MLVHRENTQDVPLFRASKYFNQSTAAFTEKFSVPTRPLYFSWSMYLLGDVYFPVFLGDVNQVPGSATLFAFDLTLAAFQLFPCVFSFVVGYRQVQRITLQEMHT